MWIAAKVAVQQGIAEPTAVLGAVADPDVFASGATTAAGQLSTATLREAVLTAVGRDRLGQAALPGGAVAAPPSVELSADGLRIEPAQAEALIRAATLAPDAVRRRLQSTVLVPGRDPVAAAALDPVLTTPDVPSPMAMALIDRDPNWFLPGIGAFPVDRATLLSPDDRFAEAVMLGANEELLNEFLWREFPTDRRGTPIRRFWPRPGGNPTSVRSTSGPATSGRTCSSTARRPR